MNHRYQISISTKEQDDELAFHRHDIYAVELKQHETNRLERLGDSLDAYNINIVICARGELAGFISLTPPNKQTFSIDKYFKRIDLPFTIDESVWETRLLTVFKKTPRECYYGVVNVRSSQVGRVSRRQADCYYWASRNLQNV